MTCIDSIRRLLLISNSTLHGSAIFRRGKKPIEAEAGSDIRPLVERTVSRVGHAA